VTFTVLARCPRTHALGVALTTSAPAVASRCPRLDGSAAVVSAQASTDWRLAERGLRLAATGLAPGLVLGALAATDPHFAYRQVGIVDRDGRAAAHTGDAAKQHRAHIVGDGFVVLGNNLASPAVVEAMAEAYRAGDGRPLADRLLRVLEAGCAAGGGNHGQLSAGLATAEPGATRSRTDLRVDLRAGDDGDAVQDLRRVFDAYEPLTDYYDRYWPDHPAVGAESWLTGQRTSA
jgi:uncharacterized Ntn-hydrolase superfamily protein